MRGDRKGTGETGNHETREERGLVMGEMFEPDEEGAFHVELATTWIVVGLMVAALEMENSIAAGVTDALTRLTAWIYNPDYTRVDDEFAAVLLTVGCWAISEVRKHRSETVDDNDAEVVDKAKLVCEVMASINEPSRALLVAFLNHEVPDEGLAFLAFFKELRAAGFDFRHFNRTVTEVATRALFAAVPEVAENLVDIVAVADSLFPEVEADLDELLI
jgi:hypothetical protein